MSQSLFAFCFTPEKTYYSSIFHAISQFSPKGLFIMVSQIGCSRDVRNYPCNWRNFRTSFESVTHLYAQLQIEPDLEQLLHTHMKSQRSLPGPIRYGHCHTHRLVLMLQLTNPQGVWLAPKAKRSPHRYANEISWDCSEVQIIT